MPGQISLKMVGFGSDINVCVLRLPKCKNVMLYISDGCMHVCNICMYELMNLSYKIILRHSVGRDSGLYPM